MSDKGKETKEFPSDNIQKRARRQTESFGNALTGNDLDKALDKAMYTMEKEKKMKLTSMETLKIEGGFRATGSGNPWQYVKYPMANIFNVKNESLDTPMQPNTDYNCQSNPNTNLRKMCKDQINLENVKGAKIQQSNSSTNIGPSGQNIYNIAKNGSPSKEQGPKDPTLAAESSAVLKKWKEINTSADGKGFHCLKCPETKSFCLATSLNRHYKQVHELICKFCKHPFLNEQVLQQHIQARHEFKCLACNKCFALKTSLNRHQKNQCQGASESKFHVKKDGTNGFISNSVKSSSMFEPDNVSSGDQFGSSIERTTLGSMSNVKVDMKMQHNLNYSNTASVSQHIPGPQIFEPNTADIKVSRTEDGGGLCEMCGKFFAKFDNCISHYMKAHSCSGPTDVKQEDKEKFCDAVSQISQFIKTDDSNIVTKNTRMIKPVPINHLQESNTTNKSPFNEKQIDNQGLTNTFVGSNKGTHAVEPEIRIARIENGGGLCLDCGTTFSQFGTSKLHFMKKHAEDGTGSHLCIVCDARFNFRVNFTEHMKAKHKISGNIQPVAEFGDEAKMARVQKEGGVDGGFCLICRQVFTQFGSLKIHFYKKHPDMKIAKPMPLQETKKSQIRKNPETRYPAEVPKEEFQNTNVHEFEKTSYPLSEPAQAVGGSYDNITLHKFSSQPAITSPMPTIGSPFKDEKPTINHGLENILDSLNNGAQTDEPEIRIARTEDGGAICLDCGKSCSRFDNCRVHFMKQHAEDGTGNHICVVCGLRFNFRVNYSEHMKMKHKLSGNIQLVSDFGNGAMLARDEKGGGVCLVCCRAFSRMDNLKAHFYTQHGK